MNMQSRDLLPILSAHDGLSCSLDSDDIAERLDEWRRVTSEAQVVSAVKDGKRFHFERDAAVGEIADLAAAEQTCCNFFEFTIAITSKEVTLDITGPEAAQPLIESFITAN